MMDSFELNKLIGGLLAVVFVMFSVSILSDAIFATPAPETPGYAIEVAETEGGEAAPEEEVIPIADLLATADPAAGEAAFRKCQACHTAEQGGANKVGPQLWDIVNRPVASAEGFSYSAAMQEFAQGGTQWTYEHLSHFLRDPRSYVPGTAMAFAGIRNPQEEADLIAYLRTLSENPAPLPEPTPADEPAPAEGEAAPSAEEGEAAPAQEDAGAEEAAPAAEAEPAEMAEPVEEGAPAEMDGPAEQAEPIEEVAPAEELAPVIDSEDQSDAAPATPDPDPEGEAVSPTTGAGTTTAEPPEEELLEGEAVE